MNVSQAVRELSDPDASPPEAPRGEVVAEVGREAVEQAIRSGFVYEVDGVLKLTDVSPSWQEA